MNNLNKPVAYIADCGTLVSDSDPFFDDYKNPDPLYSQEHFTALIKRAEKAEAFRDQMVRYVVRLGTSVIDPTVVETILTAAERSKCVGDEQ